MANVVAIDDLPGGDAVRRFEGRDHGATASSYIVQAVPPGGGPVLHVHPYDETFIVQDGQVTFTAGNRTIEAAAGQVVVVPGDTPHKFVNSGDGPLAMVTIHANDHMIQEDLEEREG
jgi:mannose-6-phosphate isomerase-like protein (cupin superfamily)